MHHEETSKKRMIANGSGLDMKDRSARASVRSSRVLVWSWVFGNAEVIKGVKMEPRKKVVLLDRHGPILLCIFHFVLVGSICNLGAGGTLLHHRVMSWMSKQPRGGVNGLDALLQQYIGFKHSFFWSVIPQCLKFPGFSIDSATSVTSDT